MSRMSSAQPPGYLLGVDVSSKPAMLIRSLVVKVRHMVLSVYQAFLLKVSESLVVI